MPPRTMELLLKTQTEMEYVYLLSLGLLGGDKHIVGAVAKPFGVETRVGDLAGVGFTGANPCEC